MEKRNKTALIVSFLIVLVAVLVVDVSFLKITYYSEFDMFGPLSKYPLILLAQFSLPILFMMILLKRRETSPIILLIPFILLITIKYVGVELADAFYITSFYDSPGHFKKGLYVTVAGQSNPKIDSYFDLQPAFFWVTAMLFNICGAPESLADLSSILIIKWFPIFAVTVYIPILYLFYKRLLGKPLLVSTALFLNFGMEIIHYHYAAETYGRAVYWFLLTTIFYFMKRRDLRCLILALLAGFSLIFLHEGLLILTLLAFIALVIYPAPFRVLSTARNRFFHKEFFTLPITLGVTWFSYLIYLTLYQFKMVVLTIQRVIETLIMENVQIIPSSITRPYVDWEQIVFYKAIYILVLVASGLILSFVNAYRKRDEADKLAFSIVLLSATFFSGAAITLGGAGYIERLPSAILPILVYSMVEYASSLKLREPRKVTSLLVAVPLIVLIFTGSAFYMSGRNFQSITYGEYYSTVFLVNKDPQNIMGIYSGLKVTSVRDVINAELENKSTSQITAISIDRYKITETYYYTCANMSLINASIRKLQQEMAVIYSNPDAVMLLRNR